MTRTANILRQATRPAGMDFTGTWQVYHEENLDEYLKELGAPEIITKMRGKIKPVFVIEQDGENFTFTIKTPAFTKVQKFSIGKETEFATVDGRKYKCTIRVEDGKLIAENEKFTSVREIQGDEMIETSTAGSVTFISKAKRA